MNIIIDKGKWGTGMATNEEYLDNLLKAFEEEEKAREKENKIPQEKTIIKDDNDDSMPLIDDVADLMSMLEAESLPQDVLQEEVLQQDVLPEESLPEESLMEESLSGESTPEEQLPESNTEELLEGVPAEDIADLMSMLKEETLPEEVLSQPQTEEVPADDIADLMSMFGAEAFADTSVVNEDTSEEIMNLLNTSEDDLLKMLQEDSPTDASGENSTDLFSIEEDSEWKGDLDELLAAAVDKLDENDIDITQMIDGLDNADESLSEINELLKKSDNNELVEAFSEMNTNSDVNAEETDTPKKRKKARKEKKADKEKKDSGVLGQFWKALLEDEDDDKQEEDGKASSEDDELLKQLENSNKKEKKKEKKKKEKKNKKAKQNLAESDEDFGDTKGGKSKKPKKKREKKPKVKAETNSALKEPYKRVLSPKALLVLVAFCASLIAMIVCLSAFIPEYIEKNQAREAFYHGDYEKAHVLLYGKNLNESDKLILDRVTVVLQLDRKLEAYYLNEEVGKKALALDSLLQGISYYQELSDKNAYGAGEDLKISYQKILDILEQKYGVDEAKALEVLACDDIRYSVWIYKVAEVMEFEAVNEAEDIIQEEPEGPQDVLPEEEDIINTKTSN